MYSLDACYTPAKGEGPCTEDESEMIDHEPQRNVNLLLIRVIM